MGGVHIKVHIQWLFGNVHMSCFAISIKTTHR